MTISHPLAPIDGTDYELLPVRFERLDDGRAVLTNAVGEHEIVAGAEVDFLADLSLAEPALLRRLAGRQIIRRRGDELPVELLALKTRTRHRRLLEMTGLHIFVVSLRCEHACGYCQVSRRGSGHTEFDMTDEIADAALAIAFDGPSSAVKIEFQGGEPLLNFPLIKRIVERSRSFAAGGRDVAYVIATNLALLDEEVLDYAAEHNISFSTSLDGPRELHNRNRPRPGGDSWERAVAGIDRVRQRLGEDRVSALMTTTEESLTQPREIVDSYVALGLREIFLRPISPYGFAVRSTQSVNYAADRWFEFYEAGLRYIIELNKRGIPMVEQYASIILQKMLTSDDPGYVDLTSPAGIGLGALIYNYDGTVYASDEGRMLAEMGDKTFALGDVRTHSYSELLLAPVLLDALDQSFSASVPMCSDCAFEQWCGADPVFHHATAGDFVGRKAESSFCTRNMAIFKLLVTMLADDDDAREVLMGWVGA